MHSLLHRQLGAFRKNLRIRIATAPHLYEFLLSEVENSLQLAHRRQPSISRRHAYMHSNRARYKIQGLATSANVDLVAYVCVCVLQTRYRCQCAPMWVVAMRERVSSLAIDILPFKNSGCRSTLICQLDSRKTTRSLGRIESRELIAQSMLLAVDGASLPVSI